MEQPEPQDAMSDDKEPAPPLRIRYFTGDVGTPPTPAHRQHLQEARNLLESVRAQKAVFGTQQVRRTITLSDGTVIAATTSLGFDEIKMSVPVPPPPTSSSSSSDTNSSMDEVVDKLEPKPLLDYSIWLVMTKVNETNRPRDVAISEWTPSGGFTGRSIDLDECFFVYSAIDGWFWSHHAVNYNTGAPTSIELRRTDAATKLVEVLYSHSVSGAKIGDWFGVLTLTPRGVLYVHGSSGPDSSYAPKYVMLSKEGKVLYSASQQNAESSDQLWNFTNDGDFAYLSTGAPSRMAVINTQTLADSSVSEAETSFAVDSYAHKEGGVVGWRRKGNPDENEETAELVYKAPVNTGASPTTIQTVFVPGENYPYPSPANYNTTAAALATVDGNFVVATARDMYSINAETNLVTNSVSTTSFGITHINEQNSDQFVYINAAMPSSAIIPDGNSVLAIYREYPRSGKPFGESTVVFVDADSLTGDFYKIEDAVGYVVEYSPAEDEADQEAAEELLGRVNAGAQPAYFRF